MSDNNAMILGLAGLAAAYYVYTQVQAVKKTADEAKKSVDAAKKRLDKPLLTTFSRTLDPVTGKVSRMLTRGTAVTGDFVSTNDATSPNFHLYLLDSLSATELATIKASPSVRVLVDIMTVHAATTVASPTRIRFRPSVNVLKTGTGSTKSDWLSVYTKEYFQYDADGVYDTTYLQGTAFELVRGVHYTDSSVDIRPGFTVEAGTIKQTAETRMRWSVIVPVASA